MIEQGSKEWLLERCGYVTASRLKDVLAKGQGKTRESYMRRIIAERLTLTPAPSFTNSAMEWGTRNEPLARMRYELGTDLVVRETGFTKHPTIKWVGGSPDGLTDIGGVEFKCPESTTHLDWLESGKLPAEHAAQVQGLMWVHDSEVWDFVSFDPRFTDEYLQYFCVRVKRDDDYIANLEKEVVRFLDEVSERINFIGRLKK